MKKFLPGILGVILAVGCTAFLTTTKKPSLKQTGDACSDASKRWFKIKLDCSGQVQVGDIRNPANYILSNTQEVTGLCQGSSCVCAIWACPKGPQYVLPDIGSTTTIYTELYNYFVYHDWITGGVGGDVLLKDQP